MSRETRGLQQSDHDLLIENTILLRELISDLKEFEKTHNERYDAMEIRIRTLENGHSRMVGYGAGAGLVGSVVFTVLQKLLKF
jgi:uncharacterized protein YllA (UPF0747 family)